jgi:hypothetical protein
MTKINAQISILAMQDGTVHITIDDKDAHVKFVDIVLTSEQYVRATMMRLACCDVKETEIRALEKVGKIEEYKTFEFEIPVTTLFDENVKDIAIISLNKQIPCGWVGDTGFNSQDSFFEKNGKYYARTMIRRWVEKE